jgi:hypothetical protein
MSTVTDKLRILVEKHCLHKGKRGVVCRVFPPGASSRTYTVILEHNRVREQIFIESSTVALYDRTGNDQHILNSIRTAMHNMERMEKKVDNRKPRA